MSPSIPCIPKSISSSTHSLGTTFRPYYQQSQKYTSPKVKLETVFTREPSHLKSLRLHYSIDKRKQNMTCINIGMDEEDGGSEVMCEVRRPAMRGKFKPARVRKQQSKTSNVTSSNDRPKCYKRNRHQSVFNLAEKYTLFSPDQEKKKLQVHEKKLTDSLSKTQQSFKSSQEVVSGIKLFSYFNSSNTRPVRDKKFEDERCKAEEASKLSLNQHKMSKWKFWAHQIHDMKKNSIQPFVLYRTQTKLVGDGKRRLTRRHYKQNATISVFPHCSGNQSPAVKKSVLNQTSQQKKQRSLLKENYQKTLMLKQKFKFRRVEVQFEGQKENLQLLQGEEDSLSKLRSILKLKKSSQSRQIREEVNLFVEPWDYIPSEGEIEVEV